MKKSAKNCIEKLNVELKAYPTTNKEQESKLTNDIINNISILTGFINTTNYKKLKEVEKVNELIYKDLTVNLMIKLMPVCNQVILNSISGLLQTTILKFPDNSLPSHFMRQTNDLNSLFLMFDNIAVGSTAHIIFRACLIRNRSFAEFILKNNYAIWFFQYLVDDNFDKIGPAFASFDIILNTYVDLSVEHISSNWTLYLLQFKILLHSNSYIILSYFLNILYKFLNCRECKNLMMKFIDDPENLVIIMNLLKSPKRRLSVGSYNIFKLFAMNARRSKYTLSVLKENKDTLLQLLTNYTVPDVPTNQEVIDDEHEQLLNEIRNIK